MFEQIARLDFRNDPVAPKRGMLLTMGVQEAGFVLPGSWNYIRLTPEARGYVPLPLGLVFATRVGLGYLHVFDSKINSENLLASLGPELFRFRGGGATSNRGFLPGRLGDGIAGGQRRWEASAELRVPLSTDFGVAVFLDAGDVSQSPVFRFDHPQTSTGFGFRYNTLVGPLRLDFGWRIPGLQVFGQDERPLLRDNTVVNVGLFKFQGAVHITIGEAF
jgi:outer membrane protein assembly factor BamA